MFWKIKLRSVWRPRRHRVTVSRPPKAKGPGAVIRTESIREGNMLLDALLKRGVEYPHLCKLGDCRRCKSMLASGSVERASHYPGALSAEEIERGVFLACRATPLTDCTIYPVREENSET